MCIYLCMYVCMYLAIYLSVKGLGFMCVCVYVYVCVRVYNRGRDQGSVDEGQEGKAWRRHQGERAAEILIHS